MTPMIKPVDVVRRFSSALAIGDVDGMLGLMSDNVEWITMDAWRNPEENEIRQLTDFISLSLGEKYASWWAYELNGRGRQEIDKFILNPLLRKGATYIPSRTEFKTDGNKVVWTGGYSGAGKLTSESNMSSYAHVYIIEKDKIARVFQFFYTLQIPEGCLQ